MQRMFFVKRNVLWFYHAIYIKKLKKIEIEKLYKKYV